MNRSIRRKCSIFAKLDRITYRCSLSYTYQINNVLAICQMFIQQYWNWFFYLFTLQFVNDYNGVILHSSVSYFRLIIIQNTACRYFLNIFVVNFEGKRRFIYISLSASMVGIVRIKEVYQKRYCLLPTNKRIFFFSNWTSQMWKFDI